MARRPGLACLCWEFIIKRASRELNWGPHPLAAKGTLASSVPVLRASPPGGRRGPAFRSSIPVRIIAASPGMTRLTMSYELLWGPS